MTISSPTVTGNTAPDGTAGGPFLGSVGALDGSASLQGSVVSGTRGDECIIFYGGVARPQGAGPDAGAFEVEVPWPDLSAGYGPLPVHHQPTRPFAGLD